MAFSCAATAAACIFLLQTETAHGVCVRAVGTHERGLSRIRLRVGQKPSSNRAKDRSAHTSGLVPSNWSPSLRISTAFSHFFNSQSAWPRLKYTTAGMMTEAGDGQRQRIGSISRLPILFVERRVACRELCSGFGRSALGTAAHLTVFTQAQGDTEMGYIDDGDRYESLIRHVYEYENEYEYEYEEKGDFTGETKKVQPDARNRQNGQRIAPCRGAAEDVRWVQSRGALP
jgi:hypothetical protein